VIRPRRLMAWGEGLTATRGTRARGLRQFRAWMWRRRSAAQCMQCSAVQCRASVLWSAAMPSYRRVLSSLVRLLASRLAAPRIPTKKKKSRRAQKGGEGGKAEGEERGRRKKAPCHVHGVAGMSCHCMAITSTLPTYIELSRLDTYARPNKQTNKQTSKQAREREERTHPIPPSSSCQFVAPVRHTISCHAIASQVENVFRRAPLLRRGQRKHIHIHIMHHAIQVGRSSEEPRKRERERYSKRLGRLPTCLPTTKRGKAK
jgi:hypothetical protein